MDCWKCEYHEEELDMGGGKFCVCCYPNIKCSWPNECPKDEYIRPEEKTSNIDFVINNK